MSKNSTKIDTNDSINNTVEQDTKNSGVNFGNENKPLDNENISVDGKENLGADTLKEDDLAVAPAPTPSNLDDFEADKNTVTYEDRVKQAMENNPLPPCSRDAKLDEKISKYSTYGCIPFFIVGIIVTIFDRAKYRSPWAFLLIGLAASVLAVGAVLRYRNNLKCKCSVCETQGKTLRSSAILWSVLSIGLYIAFVVFLIINLK